MLKIVKPPIKATADPVLAINAVDKKSGREIFKKAHISLTKPIIGISVREWREWQHYKDVLAEVADEAVVQKAIQDKYQVNIESMEIGYENERFVYYGRYQDEQSLLYVYYDLATGEFIKAVRLGE